MMTSDGWLNALTMDVKDTLDWRTVMKIVKCKIHSELEEQGVLLFADLSGEDQRSLIDEVEKVLQNHENYMRFAKRTSEMVDSALNLSAMQRSSTAGQWKSVMDFVTETASEGTAAFLRKWPDRQQSLSALGNQALPQAMRREVWTSSLREYVHPFDGTKLSVSESDSEILGMCSSILSMWGGGDALGQLSVYKAAISHLHAVSGGAVESHIEYVCLPVLKLLQPADGTSAQTSSGDSSAILVLETLNAMLIMSRRVELLGDWSGVPKENWVDFATAAGDSLALLDPEYHRLLCTIMGNMDSNSQRNGAISVLTRPIHKVWSLRENSPAGGGAIGEIILPLVQRLFSGVLEDLESTCFVWDILFLLGFELLPDVCVAYLLCLRITIQTALSPSSTPDALERTLNLTCGTVSAEALRHVMEQHIMPQVRARIRPPAHLHSITQFSASAKVGERFGVPSDSGQLKVRVRRVRMHPTDAQSQTEASVSNLADPQSVLSPSHHSQVDIAVFASPRSVEQEASGNSSPSILSQRSSRIHSVSHGSGEHGSLSVRYAGSTFILKVPAVNFGRDKVSNLADKILNDRSSERLLQQVVKLEKQWPSFVAKMIGLSVRLARASNLDSELLPAIKTMFPLLQDDFDKPMLRFDLDPTPDGSPLIVYAPPTEGGTSECVRTITELLSERKIVLPESKVLNMAKKLDEYSNTSGRGPLPSEGQERLPLGVSMTLDDEYEIMVGKEGDSNAAKAFGQRFRRELASILEIPEECIVIAGVHRGSIIVEFNIEAPPESPQTSRQLYASLSAMVDDQESPLHTRTQTASRAVRIHLRGAPHSVFDANARRNDVHAAPVHRPQPDAQPAPQQQKEEQQSQQAGAKPESSKAQQEKSASPVAPQPAILASVTPYSQQADAVLTNPEARQDKALQKPEPEKDDKTPEVVQPAQSEPTTEQPKLSVANVVAAKQTGAGASHLNRKYHYSVGKETRGPISFQQLKERYDAQEVTPITYVWYKQLGQQWKKLQDNVPLWDILRDSSGEDSGVDSMLSPKEVKGTPNVQESHMPLHASPAQQNDPSQSSSRTRKSDSTSRTRSEIGDDPRRVVKEKEAAEQLQCMVRRRLAMRTSGGMAQISRTKSSDEEKKQLQEILNTFFTGSMQMVREVYEGSNDESKAIKEHMQPNAQELLQEKKESELFHSFLDGCMSTVGHIFRGDEQESQRIRQELEERRQLMDHLKSSAEIEVLGHVLEAALREDAWTTGRHAKKLKKEFARLVTETEAGD